MRIQHNITAMNSYRNFATNNSMLGKNLEKLSSGYKVNRAGDDAAGLAISEKMRAQITGLEGATKNAKDGISLIQTAEGALTEVHSMLNRMTTLAEQSANGTYDDSVDRFQLQKEIQALKDEIDRIADSTNFNGLKLLDGSLASNASAAENTEMQIMTIKGTRLDGAAQAGTVETEYADVVGDTYSFSLATAPASGTFEAFTFNFKDKDGNEHSLTLHSADQKSIVGFDALAAALNGGNNGLAASKANSDENPSDALRAFRETFTASYDAGTKSMQLTVKGEAKGAYLTNVYGAAGAASSDAAWNAATGTAALSTTKKDGMNAGVVVTLGGGTVNAAAGDRVQIGSKVYEFVAAVGDKPETAGATAVAIGSNVEKTTKALLDALKADGYDVALETDGTDGKIRFTNMEQISELQSGGSVSATSDNLALRDQEATKQSTKFSVSGVPAYKTSDTTGYQGTYDVTISVSYIDSEGKNQSKQITLQNIANGATQDVYASKIKSALQADAELSGLFDFNDVAGDANSFTIDSKSTDNTMNQIGSITVSATPSDMSNIHTDESQHTKIGIATEITAGLNDGKSLELRDLSQNVKAGDTVTINGKTYEFASHSGAAVGEGNTRVLLGSDGTNSLKNLSEAMTADGIKNSYDAKTGKIVFSDRDNIVEGAAGGLRMQIGDTADSYNQMTVSVEDMHVASIGIKDVDISTQDGAAAALDLIKNAINYVSDTRGSLGALQNRLDHTINNLGVMRENIQNAESLIRDTDIAEEMMSYTKNSILNQSAQAMLAQANQLPQSVLQLLQ